MIPDQFRVPVLLNEIYFSTEQDTLKYKVDPKYIEVGKWITDFMSLLSDITRTVFSADMETKLKQFETVLETLANLRVIGPLDKPLSKITHSWEYYIIGKFKLLLIAFRDICRCEKSADVTLILGPVSV